MLLAGHGDLTHDVSHAFDRGHDGAHGLTGFVDQLATRVNLLDRIANQGLDFLGRAGTALSQAAHLGRHHGKPTSLLASPCRFDCRIQRQNIGLEGDAIDDANDVHNLAGAGFDGTHGRDHPSHDLPALRRHAGGRLHQLIGLARTVGVLLDGSGQFLHGCRGFFQRTSLGFGARREIMVASGNFLGRGSYRFCALANFANRFGQAVIHVLQRSQQVADFIPPINLDARGQLA